VRRSLSDLPQLQGETNPSKSWEEKKRIRGESSRRKKCFLSCAKKWAEKEEQRKALKQPEEGIRKDAFIGRITDSPPPGTGARLVPVREKALAEHRGTFLVEGARTSSPGKLGGRRTGRIRAQEPLKASFVKEGNESLTSGGCFLKRLPLGNGARFKSWHYEGSPEKNSAAGRHSQKEEPKNKIVRQTQAFLTSAKAPAPENRGDGGGGLHRSPAGKVFRDGKKRIENGTSEERKKASEGIKKGVARGGGIRSSSILGCGSGEKGEGEQRGGEKGKTRNSLWKTGTESQHISAGERE